MFVVDHRAMLDVVTVRSYALRCKNGTDQSSTWMEQQRLAIVVSKIEGS